MNKHTFSCEIRAGVSVEVTIDTDLLGSRQQYVAVAWTGKPTPKDIRPYIDWMLTVYQQCCDMLGKRLMYAAQVAPRRVEVYVFEPGTKWKMVS